MSDDTPKRSDALIEIGSAALRQVGGYVWGDPIAQLNGRQAVLTWGEMISDPICHALLFAVEMLLRRAEWRVEPRDDSDEAKAKAAWVKAALFEQMETPWGAVMADAATMAQYGFAPCEVVYEKRKDDGFIGVRKIALRHQRSFTRWDFDPASGATTGMYQQTLTASEVFIPRAKLCLFRTTPQGDNPEGRSLLRGAYTTWRKKGEIEQGEARVALRAGGLVVLRLPRRYLDPNLPADSPERRMRAVFEQVLVATAEDRQGGLLLPSDVNPETKVPDFDISYSVPETRRSTDMGAIVERHDKRMAGSILADFVLLGQNGGGSLALGEDKTVMFSIALGGFLDMIRDEINRYVVRPLWKLNGWDEAVMPYLSHGHTEKPDLAAVGSFVKTLGDLGLMPDTLTHRNTLLAMAKLPETADDEPRTGDRAMEQQQEQQAAAMEAEAKNGEAGFQRDAALKDGERQFTAAERDKDRQHEEKLTRMQVEAKAKAGGAA